MKLPFPGRGGQRSPLHFPLFPLGGPRRWSEAAATEMGSSEGGKTEGTARRWSMPYDTAWTGGERPGSSKLAVPGGGSQDRSRSTTPGIVFNWTWLIFLSGCGGT